MGRSSDARERLIESGRSLMHERGFTAVGVSEVCARAGVNKGSFYHFFPSKQDLAREIIESYWSVFRDPLDAMAHGGGPPLDRFRNFFRENYLRNKQMKNECGKFLGCPLGNLALEMSTQSPELRTSLNNAFARYIQRFEAVLQQAVDNGDLPEQSTSKSARIVMALVEGAIMMAKTEDDPEILKGLEEEALKLVGLQQKARE
jgi:TetR/AcrR family transcriptional repressor of nem operon